MRGYNRKHAIKLLNGALQSSRGKRGARRTTTSPEPARVLKRLWLRSGQLCSKHLEPAPEVWPEHYEEHYGELSAYCREKLLRISPSGIDRPGHLNMELLKEHRKARLEVKVA